jgi:hypothetical protein
MSDEAVGTPEVVVMSLFDEIADAGAGPTADDHIRVTAEEIPVGHVTEFDKIRYNTSNHHDWVVDPESPSSLKRTQGPARTQADYDEVMSWTRTRHWIDEFHTHYRVLNIPRRHLTWMQEASHLAQIKQGMSPLYAEDVEDAVATTNVGDTFARCDRSVPVSGYFVRTDWVSLKEGVHGVGPYFGLKEILESAITAGGGHQGIDARSTEAKFYLMPWRDDMVRGREFRCFVRNGAVTAISQQHLYTPNPILAPLKTRTERDQVVANWVRLLVPFIEGVVIPRLRHSCLAHSFVTDIALLGPPPLATRGDAEGDGVVDLQRPELLRPYFIEVNPFGFEYAAGSSLFNWIEHYPILYGLSPPSTDTPTTVPTRSIHFRSTTESSEASSPTMFTLSL